MEFEPSVLGKAHCMSIWYLHSVSLADGYCSMDEKLGVPLLLSFVLIVGGVWPWLKASRRRTRKHHEVRPRRMRAWRFEKSPLSVRNHGRWYCPSLRSSRLENESLSTPSQKVLERGMARIDAFWDKGIARGKTTPEQKAEWGARLHAVGDLAAAVGTADMVIEAVPEIPDLKQSIFADLDRLAPAHAILGTNTSSLSIADIAGSHEPARTGHRHAFLQSLFQS